jgi:hypothetical protein
MLGTVISVWVAATLTIAILSFLYRDNPLYRLAEHLYVGVSAAYGVVIFWYTDVWPMLVTRFQEHLHARNYFEAWILIIPALLGLMMWTRFIPRIAWISRWPLAFTIGFGAGLGITGSIHGYILPQLKDTMRPLGNPPGTLDIGHLVFFIVILAVLAYIILKRLTRMNSTPAILLSVAFGIFGYVLLIDVLRITWLRIALSAIAADNLFIVVGVIATLLYFYFSREHKGLFGVGSRIGIAVIMVSFGASFGYTVMARVSLLIGRCYFLINDWIVRGIIAPLKAIF